MNKLLLLFVFSFCTYYAFAQDSLSHYSITELNDILEAQKKARNYNNLLPYAIAGAKKAEQEFGKQSPAYARMQYFLGFSYAERDEKDFVNARKHYEKSVAIQQVKIPTGDDYCSSLNNLGLVCLRTKDYKNAEKYFKQASNVAKKLFDTKSLDYTNILLSLSAVYLDTKRYDEAEKILLQVRGLHQEGLKPNDPAQLYPLQNLRFLYIKTRQTKKSMLNYRKIVTTTKDIYGDKHPKYANALHIMANIYKNNGRHNEAEQLYFQANKIQKDSLGEYNTQYIGGLVDLGNLYKDLGRYNKAKVLYNQAINLFETANLTSHKYYTVCLSNLVTLNRITGHYDLAEQYCLQLIDSTNRSVSSLLDLALLYEDMGRYEQSEQMYLEGLEIIKNTAGPTSKEYARCLNNLGILYYEQKRYKEAESYYLAAAALRKSIYGPEHYIYASTLTNIGLVYRAMGSLEKAEQYYLESLQIKNQIYGENHFKSSAVVDNLAALAFYKGELQKAEHLYLKVLELRRIALGEKHWQYHETLYNLGELYFKMERYEVFWDCTLKAIQYNSGITVTKALKPSKLNNLKTAVYASIPNMIHSLSLLYRFYSLNDVPGNQHKQVQVAELALFLLDKNRHSFQGEADKLRLLSQSSEWVLKSLKSLDTQEQVEEAFAIADKNKSVLLLEASNTIKAYSISDLPAALAEEEQELQKEYTTTKALLFEKRPASEIDSIRSNLNALNLEIKNFQENIETKYPKYAAIKYQQKETTVATIQQALEDKTALIEYVIADSVLYIFYIDNTSATCIEKAISSTLLKENINNLHQALSNYDLLLKNSKESYRQYTRTAYWFYDNLVAPALKHSKEIEQLIFISDGELGYLPFESFLVEPAPQSESSYANLHYLLNDFSISYNYSASFWSNNQLGRKNKNNGKMLSMAANYALKLDPTRGPKRLASHKELRTLLNPLPDAIKEVQVLEAEFDGFFGFDSLASEKVFKEKAGDYAVIHLAMHGLLDNKHSILSSLAFTEDSDSLENNFLHAYEISKLNLNTDLVVLSACETGYGTIETGNGIASLARAFMYAGASSLIVSLWQVNDLATSKIMKNLYHNLNEGMDKNKALGQAKLDYIKTSKGIMAHPAFWSPFIQIGKTSPISISKKGNLLPWIFGGGILILLGIGFGMIRKKNKK